VNTHLPCVPQLKVKPSISITIHRDHIIFLLQGNTKIISFFVAPVKNINNNAGRHKDHICSVSLTSRGFLGQHIQGLRNRTSRGFLAEPIKTNCTYISIKSYKKQHFCKIILQYKKLKPIRVQKQNQSNIQAGTS
jgi:hypothetical protein